MLWENLAHEYGLFINVKLVNCVSSEIISVEKKSITEINLFLDYVEKIKQDFNDAISCLGSMVKFQYGHQRVCYITRKCSVFIIPSCFFPLSLPSTSPLSSSIHSLTWPPPFSTSPPSPIDFFDCGRWWQSVVCHEIIVLSLALGCELHSPLLIYLLM